MGVKSRALLSCLLGGLAPETVAIRYALGEGVKRDNVAGYAWAQISQESAPRAKVQPIIDQLENSLAPEARVRVAELKGRFGKRALELHLLPVVLRARACRIHGSRDCPPVA